MFEAKAYRHEVPEGSGTMVLYGRDDAGSECSIAIPLAALRSMASTARRKLLAASAKSKRVPDAGPYRYAELYQPLRYRVGTTATPEGDRVALITDPDSDDELAFRMVPDDAREVAKDLMRSADQCSSKPEARN